MCCAAAVLLLLLLLCYADRTSAEPDGWVTRKDSSKEYWFSRAKGESRTKTWCKADDKCRALNAHLVNIGSAEENKWIAEQSTANVWIGVNKDSILSNDWGWSDGNNHGYTNWNPGEPNMNFNNCAELMPTTGKWNDNNCGCGVLTSTLKEHFVCERAAPVTVTATTVTATTKSTPTTATMPTSTTSTTTATPTTTLTTAPLTTTSTKSTGSSTMTHTMTHTSSATSDGPIISATTIATTPPAFTTAQDYAAATTPGLDTNNTDADGSADTDARPSNTTADAGESSSSSSSDNPNTGAVVGGVVGGVAVLALLIFLFWRFSGCKQCKQENESSTRRRGERREMPAAGARRSTNVQAAACRARPTRGNARRGPAAATVSNPTFSWPASTPTHGTAAVGGMLSVYNEAGPDQLVRNDAANAGADDDTAGDCAKIHGADGSSKAAAAVYLEPNLDQPGAYDDAKANATGSREAAAAAAVYLEPNLDQPGAYDDAKANAAGTDGVQTCARGAASGGRKCANKALAGKLYCKMHSCSHAGCDNSKSNKQQACSVHSEGAAEDYADLEGQQIQYGGVGGGGGGGGGGRRGQRKQASIYAGFGDEPVSEV